MTKVTALGYRFANGRNSNAHEQTCIYAELVGLMKVLPEQVRLGMDELSTHYVVLYDGVCGLCNRLNQLLLTRDSADRFRFAPLQSQFASRVLARHGIDPGRRWHPPA